MIATAAIPLLGWSNSDLLAEARDLAHNGRNRYNPYADELDRRRAAAAERARADAEFLTAFINH